MEYKLIELDAISGPECTMYSPRIIGEKLTLFENFIREYKTKYPEEIKDILLRLQIMGEETGARRGFFKENEGAMNDWVCALYDQPDHHLRLYCIRYGMNVIILGGGGFKPRDAKAWQNDPILKEHAELIKSIAIDVNSRLETRDDLRWSKDHMHLEGDFMKYGKKDS